MAHECGNCLRFAQRDAQTVSSEMELIAFCLMTDEFNVCECDASIRSTTFRCFLFEQKDRLMH